MSLTATGNIRTLDSTASAASPEWLNLVDNLSVTGGYTSGRYSKGLFNLWFGYAAAADPGVAGSHNVGLGTYAAFKNQGDHNTWVGSRAGFENLGGSENVGVGWDAGGQQTNSTGNTSLGYQSGYTALGDGNVSIGHGANSRGLTFETSCNIAVGSAAHAVGGDSIAVGADAIAQGRRSTGIGVATTVSGDNSLVIGSYVESSGNNSLLIMPRKDGKVAVHTADEELNVYGVLTGSRDADDGSYVARLESDSLELKARGVQATARRGVLHVEASSNISVLTDVSFGGPSRFNAPAVFGDQVMFASGFRSGGLGGDSVFDGRAVFNGPMSITSTSVLDVYNAAVREQLEVRDLKVTGSASVPDDFLPNPTFDSARVLGDSMFIGNATFKSGIHVCCGPVQADVVEAHTTRTHHLYVDGELSVSNAVVKLHDANIVNAQVENLFAESAYMLSNVSVSGDISGNGNIYFSSGFFGSVATGELSSTGTILCPALTASNIVCDTITVTGQNTLKVFGNSELNATKTQTLYVAENSVLENLMVSTDVYVGYHTNTNTLTVRDGTIMSKITAGTIDVSSLRADGASICNVAAGLVEGKRGDFERLDADEAYIRYLAASNALLDTLHSPLATICNLTVETLELVNGIDTSEMSFYNVNMSGETTANIFTASGNSRFEQDVTIDGTLTVNELEITQGLNFNTGLPFVFDDVVIFNKEAVFRDQVKIEGAMTAGGADFSGAVSAESVSTSGDVDLEGCIKWRNPANLFDYQWDLCLVNRQGPTADLRFASVNGTTFTLTDEFESGVLNFTGKHRCSWSGDQGSCVLEIGLIVSTTGTFNNLDGGGEPTVDESLPVVRLSTEANDPRAFGVVAGEETQGVRVFKLANMVFGRDCGGDPKVILNSVGEGGMWVCDANGGVSNGDLLTTSSVAGHAQRQGDGIVRSHTVAKMTGSPKRWEKYVDPASSRACMRAFCGVVYKF